VRGHVYAAHSCSSKNVLFTFPTVFKSIIIVISVYIFPGLGLGATVCGAKRVTDQMLYCAAVTLAKFVSDEDLRLGRVFPSLSCIREVSQQIACSVIKEAEREKLRTKMTHGQMSYLSEYVKSKMYEPIYVPLVEKREVRI
jgi:malate dehydrogenase (oxaloacetate-decarboxylating)(NADP+)